MGWQPRDVDPRPRPRVLRVLWWSTLARCSLVSPAWAVARIDTETARLAAWLVRQASSPPSFPAASAGRPMIIERPRPPAPQFVRH